MALIIDPEFHALIPPLSIDELEQLEANLERDGCREALCVWRSGSDDILLDGHNRVEICERLDIEYQTCGIDVSTRDEAREWIIRNQFGRRNLTAFQRSELALKLKPIIAAKAKAHIQAGGQSSEVGRQKSDNPVDTKKELAKLAGVSHDTIHKAEVITEQADDETKDKLRKGEISINRAYKGLKGGEKPKLKYTKIHPVSDAMQFAGIAISQLERIRADDPHREDALDVVSGWIISHRGGGESDG